MAKVQHPSGSPTWEVDDPRVFVAAGWKELTANDGLARKTVAQLQQIAADRGIDLGDAHRKADIITALESVS